MASHQSVYLSSPYSKHYTDTAMADAHVGAVSAHACWAWTGAYGRSRRSNMCRFPRPLHPWRSGPYVYPPDKPTQRPQVFHFRRDVWVLYGTNRHLHHAHRLGLLFA